MTAVIGILNKHGVALAADSAVTRTRSYGRGEVEKCTKNGNKMLRVSNAVPVAVMITGNASFLYNPWEIIVRCYRQDRGNIQHETVAACIKDFFDYISGNERLWNEEWVQYWVRHICDFVFNYAASRCRETHPELTETKEDGSFVRPKALIKSFKSLLKKMRKFDLQMGICPDFSDYTIGQFLEYAGKSIQTVIDVHSIDMDSEYNLPKEIIEAIRPELELAFLSRLTTPHERESAELIFTGFGAAEEFPSLISVNVFQGFDRRVNYYIRPQDIIHISDDRPVAICPFAQKDVANSILRGMHSNYGNMLDLDRIFRITDSEDSMDDDIDMDDIGFEMELMDVNTSDLKDKIVIYTKRALQNNQRQWEHLLENYDIKAMAALAHSLIDLTGFQRILTFQEEGVGGPVDLAVITRNDGFTWLSRKSWYHHKDVNGQYGSLGI